MLQYVSFKDYKKTKNLYKLWNREFKRIYPISSALFKERILDDVNFDKNNSYVALYERVPIGFIAIKKWQDDSLFYAIKDRATISLLYVQKDVRNMGVGSELLELALEGLKNQTAISKIQLGNDLLNIFPGLPSELTKTTPFLINNEFVNKDGCADMIQLARESKFQRNFETEKELTIRIATEEDQDHLLKMCLDNGMEKEAYLLKRYFENGGSGRRIVLGLVDEKIIGFVRIFDKKKIAPKVNFFLEKKVGSLGLMGMDKDFREGNYAEKLCVEATKYLIMRGCKKIVVESTKDIEFYKKLGFKAFKYYLNFEKEIKRD